MTKLWPPIASLQGNELLAQNQILQKEITTRAHEALKRSEQEPAASGTLQGLYQMDVQVVLAEVVEFTPDQPFGEGQANSGEIREQFSELQTVWRWSQSPPNPSLLKIPVNREKYREFIDFLRQVWRTDTAICHIQFG